MYVKLISPNLNEASTVGSSVMPSESEGFTTSSDDPTRSAVNRESMKGDELQEKRPRRKRPAWTPEEEGILAEKHAFHGNAWMLIAKSLPGRTATEVKDIYNKTLKFMNPGAGSLLRSYVLAVQGHEEDDDLRIRAYNAALQAHEAGSAAAAEVVAATSAAAAHPLLVNPIVGMLTGMPLQMQLQARGWSLGPSLQSNRLNPQDQLRRALLQQHQLNLLQLKQQQQELNLNQRKQCQQQQQQQKELSRQQEQQPKQNQQENPRQRQGKDMHGQQEPQSPMPANHKIEDNTGAPAWQSTCEPTVGGEATPSLNPDVAAAAAAAAAAATAALERISAAVLPGGGHPRIGVNGDGVNRAGTVDEALGVVPSGPIQGGPLADMGPRPLDEGPDKGREEEAVNISASQVATAATGTGMPDGEQQPLGAGRGGIPQEETHSPVGPRGDSGALVSSRINARKRMTDDGQSPPLLPSAAPPSPRRAPGAGGSRKRPPAPAAEESSGKRVKSRSAALVRGSQARREGLFEDDEEEPDRPPHAAPAPPGPLGGRVQSILPEARRPRKGSQEELQRWSNQRDGLRRRVQEQEQEEVQEQEHVPGGRRSSRQQSQRQVPLLLSPPGRHRKQQLLPPPPQQQQLLQDDDLQPRDREPRLPPSRRHWSQRNADDKFVHTAAESLFSDQHQQYLQLREGVLQRQVRELQRQAQQLQEDKRRRLQQKPDAGGREQKSTAELRPPSRRRAARKAPAAWGGAAMDTDPSQEVVELQHEEEDEEQGQQPVEEEAREEYWQQEMYGRGLGLDVLDSEPLMPPSGGPPFRSKPPPGEPDISPLLENLAPAPAGDPPMVLLRRNGAPPILCVAVPLGVVTNPEVALANLPVGDLPPSSNLNFSAGAPGTWGAAAAPGASPLGEEDLPLQPRENLQMGRRGLINPRGRGGPDPGQEGFDVLAAAAAAAAVGLPPASRRALRRTAGDARDTEGVQGRPSKRGRLPPGFPAATTASGGGGGGGAKDAGRSLRGGHMGSGLASPRVTHGAVSSPEHAAEVLMGAAAGTGGGGAGTTTGRHGSRHGAGQGGSWRQQEAPGGGSQQQQRSGARGALTAAESEVEAEADASDKETAAPIPVNGLTVRELPQPMAPRDPRRRLLSRGDGAAEPGDAGQGGSGTFVAGGYGSRVPPAKRAAAAAATAAAESEPEGDEAHGSSDSEKADADPAGLYPDREDGLFRLYPALPVQATALPFLSGTRLMGPFVGSYMGPYMSPYITPYMSQELVDLVEGSGLGPDEYEDDDDAGTINTDRAYENLLHAFPGTARRGGLGPLGGLGPSPAGRPLSGGSGKSGSAPAAWAAATTAAVAAATAARRGGPPFLPPQMMSPQALYGMQVPYLMAAQMAGGGMHPMMPPGRMMPPPQRKVHQAGQQPLKQPRRVGARTREPIPVTDSEERATAEQAATANEGGDGDGGGGGGPQQLVSQSVAPPHQTSRSGRKIIRRYDDAMEYDE